MITKKNRSYFKALLKSETGEILAEGDAAVNIPNRYVTFRSGFVPLYPIGTPMEIVRLNEDKEIHSFTGKVYLSDKNLMRIVSVDDRLLPGSEDLYCKNMNFSATVSSSFSIDLNTRVFFKRGREKQEYRTLDVFIKEMTDSYLIFQLDGSGFAMEEPQGEPNKYDYLEQTDPIFDVQIEEGQRLIINSSSLLPPLKDVTIEVVTPFYFGTSPSFRCIYPDISPEDKSALSTFLWQFNIMRNKLF